MIYTFSLGIHICQETKSWNHWKDPKPKRKYYFIHKDEGEESEPTDHLSRYLLYGLLSVVDFLVECRFSIVIIWLYEPRCEKNLSSGGFDHIKLKPVCSITETG